MNKIPKLYDELADWWQIISPTSDYEDEATFFGNIFKQADTKTILELGAGGGNIAFFMKNQFKMTLTDIAPKMIAMSKKQNPDCEHSVGDMLTLRLGREFDGVFIHDAIMYLTSEQELIAAFKTAALHCGEGGTLIIAPDFTSETFEEETEYQGRDIGERSVRFIQWTTDPNPNDHEVNYDIILALKEDDNITTVVDRHRNGLFPKSRWIELLNDAGFNASFISDTSSLNEKTNREIIVASKK